jgi:hypothetical protein
MGKRIAVLFKSFLLLIPVSIFAQENQLVNLKDFYPDRLESAGFTLESSQEITISTAAINAFRSNRPFTYAWILDSKSRDIVWLLEDAEEVDDDDHVTTYKDAVTLEPGNYEVYYSTFMNFNDYQYWGNDNGHRGFFGRLFGGWWDDNDRRDIRRKDYKELFIKITGNGIARDESQVRAWNIARQEQAIINFTAAGDDYFEEKILNVSKPVKIKVYAIGEATSDGDYDFGWITDLKSREKIWTLDYRNSMDAGGAKKNRLAENIIELQPGKYKVAYVTDDSHCYEKWNSAPPYDPEYWGLAIWLEPESDMTAVAVEDVSAYEDKNMVINFDKVRDNDYRSEGFTLKKPLTLHIFALGEGRDGEMFDYGWIVNGKTHERVWQMDYYDTEHAGGAQKNRMFDDTINLEAGNYVAYYVSDGSHSYRRWNAGRPFYEEKWGMQINVLDDNYKEGDVSAYNEDEDSSVLVHINKVGDYDRARASFTLSKDQKVHIYAIGEGSQNEMYDYAWIENSKTGRTVWEMTYRKTERAGGAKKNRLFDDDIFLEAGHYDVFYKTDDSHSFGDWNASPPNDPINWGITIKTTEQ